MAKERANVIALDHDQFKASGHYTNAVSLGVTVETNGPDHIDRILEALKEAGFPAQAHLLIVEARGSANSPGITLVVPIRLRIGTTNV